MVNPAEVGMAAAVGRLVAAALAGGVIGLEREVDGHEAGVRTHLLLAMGAGLFGLVSVAAFHGFVSGANTTNINFDPSRVASYVVAGVGFLGAGAILKQSDRIRGLTTAASLWVAASAGLAAGLGYWVGVVVVTVLALIALLLDRPLRKLTRRLGAARGLVVHLSPGAEPVGALDLAMACAGARVLRLAVDRRGGDDHATVSIDLVDLPHDLVVKLTNALSAHPDVTHVEPARRG
ncbi:MAG: putative Mg2+ transporter-C (MgtC) family protein [Acidimicrobiaceae bacterium]|nr:putative Mg2+ transporter-C (MgtC) family protein [Acidimicrobiaceae bacterium]